MEWQLNHSAGPRGYLIENQTFETIEITMPEPGVAAAAALAGRFVDVRQFAGTTGAR